MMMQKGSKMAEQPMAVKNETFVERLAAKIGANIQASAIFAPPVARDGMTVIPVARAAWGFGGGGAQRQGTGGGGGVRLSPVGYIEITPQQTRFRQIFDAWAIIALALGGSVVAWLLAREVRLLLSSRSQQETVVATVVESETSIPQDAAFSEMPVS
jgi:uncharacterized spore protein YtfJ